MLFEVRSPPFAVVHFDVSKSMSLVLAEDHDIALLRLVLLVRYDRSAMLQQEWTVVYGIDRMAFRIQASGLKTFAANRCANMPRYARRMLVHVVGELVFI